jgi:signal transduction histidine kinase/DNA-binding response OmpR family regulator
MIRLFRRLPLNVKLILLAVIPLAMLIFFMLQINVERSQKIEIIESYLQKANSVASISDAVDELQSERRYSFAYLLKKDLRNELVIQRPKTDAIITHLENSRQYPGLRGYTFLDSLRAIRKKIDSNEITPDEVMSYYTNTIIRVNSLNNISAGNLLLQPILKDIAAQKLLTEMITNLGIQRAAIYYDMYLGRDVPSSRENLKTERAMYESYQRELILKGSTETVNAYSEMLKRAPLKPVQDHIQQVLATNHLGNTYSAESWWDISASAVDSLKALQQATMTRAQEGMVNLNNKEQTARDRTLLLLVVIIIVVLFIMMYTIIVITQMLNKLNVAAQQISRGETGLEIQKESTDVIGQLAQSIVRIDKSNLVLAKAAAAIGTGDFTVELRPRSENDILVNSVIRMKDDLKQFTEENQQKLWIHGGLEKVNESVRGEKDVPTLAHDALDTLTEYVGGHVALLYMKYSGFFEYAGGYAVADDSTITRRLNDGDSLLGTAAQKQRIIRLNDVPSDFVKIKSSTGSTQPRNVLIVPLVHNGITEGVIEIAGLDEFSALAEFFLTQAAAPVAVALQAAKSRSRLQELLEETQSQSEELQAQHSELENVNSELEAQAEKLQTSEEELRVQQEELLQVNQEMEERSRLLEERNQVIVERNLEIQQKVEELAISTKYKSEFLANMSHELRTPLNSVLLLSRLLSENNENNLTKEQVEYANVIQSSGQGLLSLIDEILDLSKIEAGKMELEYQPIMLRAVAEDMRSLFGPVAKERGVDLNIFIDQGVPSQIETDKLRLEQILKNLLSNALKFTSKGSVNLNITPLKDNHSFICLTVKDTGIGIPKEKQDLIFEAFQQADGSTRRKYGGTGLGLSISRELSKLLGGEIKVTSEPGKGSEFTVYIPVKKTFVQQKPAEVERHVPVQLLAMEDETRPSSPAFLSQTIPESIPDDRNAIKNDDKVILIVEDDTAFAKALLEFTRAKGYRGLVAVRGDEGIALAQQYNPVGILLDIQLPVKDGWEVMEELKSNSHTRHIPVHVMSSLEAKKESLTKGAVDFINKPVAFEQMQEVFKKIEKVISREHKKVLIVEENSKHAKALAYFLETFNVNAQISDSIHNGISSLKTDEVDCVILDMGIPDQRAYETLDQVKKNLGLEHLPVIIFTGKNLSKVEESRIKQYADSIVIKTAHSYQRILDEVSLFLHLVEGNNQGERAIKYKRLGALNEVLAGKKVLVTDDDVRNIFSLTKALEIHNMKVITAVDGKEALKQLQENPDTDVVLMDIMMPEMDGYEAMQQIRKKKQFQKLPIIAVTAKAMTGDREKCIRAGASDYISKPVDIDQLLSLLRVWLYDKSI